MQKSKRGKGKNKYKGEKLRSAVAAIACKLMQLLIQIDCIKVW